MTFNEGARLDTRTVGGGRGGGRSGMAVGGGIGGLVLLLLGAVFGVDLTGGGAGAPGVANQAQADDRTAQLQQACRTGADANKYVECRIIGTENTAHAFWSQTLPGSQVQYQRPSTVIFSGSTNTGCGAASSQTGPFYCPADETMYFDVSFFELLSSRFGASNGALAQEYVVAHEFGHHIQNELGLLRKAQQDPQGPKSGAVRVELMADCLAGVWAHHASRTVDANGNPFLQPLTRQDIQDALSAAAAVGDDRIQKAATGSVNPHTFTHGTSEQRQQWFIKGYQSGDLQTCDTFANPNL